MPECHAGWVEVVVLLYDGVSAAEILGPCEVLRRLPAAECRFVAEEPRPYLAHGPALSLDAGEVLEQVDWADLLVVPGGFGCRELICNQRLVEWIQRLHQTTRWTTAVSTGSVLLAAAGLLTGKAATTHWLAGDLLAHFGVTPVPERVVRAGRILTAAGPAAAINMSLWMAAQSGGPAIARRIHGEVVIGLDTSFDRPFSSPTAAAIVAGWRTPRREAHSWADRGRVLWHRLRRSAQGGVPEAEQTRGTPSDGGIWELEDYVPEP